jgi:hypothetical protein
MNQSGNRNIAFAISAVVLLSMLTAVTLFPRADSLSPSIVFISADSEIKQVPDGNDISFIIKFHNNHQNSVEVLLEYEFNDGLDPWDSYWADANDNIVDDTYPVMLLASQITEFHFTVSAPVNSYETNRTVWVYGIDSYSLSGKSGNITVKENDDPLIITVSSIQAYKQELMVDILSNNGDNLIYQGQDVEFGFQLINDGASSDSFEMVVLSNSTIPASAVTFESQTGILKGYMDAVDPLDQYVNGKIIVNPGNDLLPGEYSLNVAAVFEGGGEVKPVNQTLSLEAILPDLQFTGDGITIINVGDIELVKGSVVFGQIEVTNTGGNVDSQGLFVDNILVNFSGEGVIIEPDNFTIPSLLHSETYIITFAIRITGTEVPVLKAEIEGKEDVDFFESNDENNMLNGTVAYEPPPPSDSGGIPSINILQVSAILFVVSFIGRRKR